MARRSMTESKFFSSYLMASDLLPGSRLQVLQRPAKTLLSLAVAICKREIRSDGQPAGDSTIMLQEMYPQASRCGSEAS